MDYLYLNAIVKEVYRDLPCACPFPTEYRNILGNHHDKHDVMSNPSVPLVFSFSALTLDQKDPLMVYTQVQKHTNSASVGRMTQSIGWFWDGNLVRDNMRGLLETGFYSESQVNDIALRQEVFALPKSLCTQWSITPMQFSQPVKLAILNTIFLRWIRFDAPLRIAVPKDADYNSYVISAAAQIYQLLPVFLRVQSGFISYMPSTRNVPANFSFGFVPADKATSDTLFLDGSSPAVCNKLSQGTNNPTMDTLIKYIATQPEASLQPFFSALYRDLEGNGDGRTLLQINVPKYSVVGESLNILNSTNSGEKEFNLWNTFLRNPDSFPTFLRERLFSHIQHTLNPDEICITLRNACGDCTDVFAKLPDYRLLCGIAPTLADRLWDEALKILRSQNLSASQIFELAQPQTEKLADFTNEKKLYALCDEYVTTELATLDLKPRETVEALQSLRTAAVQLLNNVENSKFPRKETFYDRINQYIAELDTQHADLLYNDYSDQLEQLEKRPTATISQIHQVLQDAQVLKKLVETAPQTGCIPLLSKTLENFIEKRTAQANSSDALIRDIIQLIDSLSFCSYFDLLSKLDQKNKSSLDKNHLDEIAEKLKNYRPITLNAYDDEFYKHYRTKLTLQAILKESEYVRNIMLSDICQLQKLQVQILPGNSAADSARKLACAEYLSGKLAPMCKVDAMLEGDTYTFEYIYKLLTLTHTKSSIGSKRDFEHNFNTFLDAGAFTGKDLVPAVDMMIRCDADPLRFIPRILAGKFDGCGKRQYLAAFRMMIDHSNKSPADYVEELYQESLVGIISQDAAAALEQLCKDYKAGPHRPKRTENNNRRFLLPTIIGAVLLIAVVVACIVIFDPFSEKDPVETTAPMETTAPAVTEPQIQHPALLQFLSSNAAGLDILLPEGRTADFADYNLKVNQFLDSIDDEQMTILLNDYTNLSDTRVSLGQGQISVSYREYFFWLCLLNADASDTSESDEAVDPVNILLNDSQACEEVLSLLRVLHAGQSEEYIDTYIKTSDGSSEDQTSQSTPNPNDNQSPQGDQGNNDEPGDENGEIHNNQPAPKTPDEMKSEIIQAAGFCYDTAADQLEHLGLILSIFGRDFSVDFQNHADLVSQFQNSDIFLNRSNLHPAGTIAKFVDLDFEVNWEEYVFWEFWLLARRGIDPHQESAFSIDLHKDVCQVLNLVHQLIDETPTVAPVPYQFVTDSEAISGTESGAELDTASNDSFARVVAIAKSIFDEAKEQYAQLFAEID